MTGTSEAVLTRCLSHFRTIQSSLHPISRLRDFTRFRSKTSYRLVNRGRDMKKKTTVTSPSKCSKRKSGDRKKSSDVKRAPWRCKSPATRLNPRPKKKPKHRITVYLRYCPIHLFFFYRSRGAFITGKYAHRVGMQVSTSLLWRHNGLDGVSNHQPDDCFLNRLFRRKSKKTSKLRVTGFCAGNSPVTGEFPAQMATYTENASIWWRHHGISDEIEI